MNDINLDKKKSYTDIVFFDNYICYICFLDNYICVTADDICVSNLYFDIYILYHLTLTLLNDVLVSLKGKNTGCPLNFAFHVNKENYFSNSVSHVTFETDLGL